MDSTAMSTEAERLGEEIKESIRVLQGKWTGLLGRDSPELMARVDRLVSLAKQAERVPLTDERIATYAARVTELERAVKWEQHYAGRIGTHGPGCHTWGPGHYFCLQRHVESLETDAARYRLLRKEINGERWELFHDAGGSDPLDMEALDAAIDQAMAGDSAQGQRP